MPSKISFNNKPCNTNVRKIFYLNNFVLLLMERELNEQQLIGHFDPGSREGIRLTWFQLVTLILIEYQQYATYSSSTAPTYR